MNRPTGSVVATVAATLLVVAALWAPVSSFAQTTEPAKTAVKHTFDPPAEPTAEVPSIKFDKVSFKLCKDGIDHTHTRTILPDGGDFVGYDCQSMRMVIGFGYTWSGPLHLSGEPAWADTEGYEFQAKVAPEDLAAWQKMRVSTKRIMVRNMLADNLHLKVHIVTEFHSMYALVVAPGGPKLKEHKDGDTTTLPNGRVLVGIDDSAFTSPYEAVFQSTGMNSLVLILSLRVGRDVIDKTGLPGHYDFTLAIPNRYYDPTVPDADGSHIPAIFDSLEKLGLKLEPVDVESPTIVVDHIDRPVE